jgi:threonine/homoserine/homoserine lactone efflux protein
MFAAIFAALAPKGGFEPMTAAATVSGVTLGSLLWWVFIVGGVTLFRHALGRRVRLWIDRLAGSFLMFFGVAEIRRGL